MKSPEEIQYRTSWNYLREHNGNTGLTSEEYLTTIKDPETRVMLEEYLKEVPPTSSPYTSGGFDSEFRNELIQESKHWRDENPEEAAVCEEYMEQMIIHEAPQKKSKIGKRINYSEIENSLEPFDLIMVNFPYLDSVDKFEFHPTFYMPCKNYDGTISNRFIFVTSGKYTNEIFRLYESSIEDWNISGLKHLSYARLDKAVFSDKIIFIKRSEYKLGKLTKKDKKDVILKRIKFANECLKHPVAFLGFLIENGISDPIPSDGSDNNNVNKIQSVEEIAATHTGNCVDIAIAVYKMCQNYKEFKSSQIASVSWPIRNKPGSSNGHLFTMFEYKDCRYVFDYDQVHRIGTFRYWYSRYNYSLVAKKFSDKIRLESKDFNIRNSDPEKQQIILLTEEQHRRTLNNLDEFKTQKDWLRYIKFELQEVNPVKESIFLKNISKFERDLFIWLEEMDRKKAGH